MLCTFVPNVVIDSIVWPSNGCVLIAAAITVEQLSINDFLSSLSQITSFSRKWIKYSIMMYTIVFTCLLSSFVVKALENENSDCASNFLENATSTLHKLDNNSRSILVDLVRSLGFTMGDPFGVTFGSSGSNRKCNHCTLYNNVTKFYKIDGDWLDTPYPWCQVRREFFLYDTNNKSVKLDQSVVQNFTSSRPIFVLVHGFMQESPIPEWASAAKDALINLNYNVIIVSWDSISVGFDYGAAIADARLVADTLAALLLNMITINVTTAEKLVLVGHSLGAHICGMAAEQIPNLRGVIALDPAGPFFDCHPRIGLRRNVARVVQVLHTDYAGFSHFGSKLDRGHVDYYVDQKDGVQRGCSTSNDDMISILLQKPEKTACSHNLAVQIFVRAISRECKFEAKRCGDYPSEVFSPKSLAELTGKDYKLNLILGKFEVSNECF